MKNLVSKDLKLYYKQIKSLLPLRGKQERRFLENFKGDVEDYVERNQDATVDDVTSEFGEPTEVAFSYLESIESEDLYKRLSVSRVIKRVVLIVLALVVAYFIFIFTLAYMDYLAAQDQHVVKEETTIIIEESTE